MFDSKELSWIRQALEESLNNSNWERSAENYMRHLIAKIYHEEKIAG